MARRGDRRPSFHADRSRANAAAAAVLALSACGGDAGTDDSMPGAGSTSGDFEPDTSPSGVLDGPVERPRAGDARAAAALVQQAEALERAARFDDARRAYDEAVARDPAHLPALIGGGFLLLSRGEEEAGQALLRFRRARAIEPGSAEAICGEGVARALHADWGRAEPLLRRAREELPREAARRRALATAALADLCAAGDRTGEALSLYGEADALLATARGVPAVERASVLVRAADLLARLDRASEAEAKLGLALAQDPEHVRGHYLLSRLLARRGADDEARREARIHELFRALRDHVTPRFMKDVERRVALWREIAAIYPEHRRAGHELVRELLDGMRWDDALAEIDALARRDGATAETHYLAARAHAGRGDLAAARAAADLMRRADPAVPPAVLRAVLEDWKRGDPRIDPATYERTMREWLGGG
jgi:hypothetical protein